MTTAKLILFGALALTTLWYVAVWVRQILQRRSAGAAVVPTAGETGLGFVTNFFDTLGIGSFAPTTSAFKLWKMVDDRVIPGTLNVGHTLPVVAQAFIFIAVVSVDTTTLIALIVSAVLGTWIGAGFIAKWPRRMVQIGMGVALLAAAALMLASQLKLVPGGGDATSLTGAKLVAGIIGNFALGSLMALGIGLYAPCLIMISLLGMSPLAAFPIMMGSCAFLQPAGSVRFIRSGSYDLRASIGLAIGGVPAVLLAAFLVKSLPLTVIRWLVVAVVTYAAVAMIRSATKEKATVAEPSPALAGD